MATVVGHLFAEADPNGSSMVQSVGDLEPAQQEVRTQSLQES